MFKSAEERVRAIAGLAHILTEGNLVLHDASSHLPMEAWHREYPNDLLFSSYDNGGDKLGCHIVGDKNGQLPFKDNTFDICMIGSMSDFVMEELTRVLKVDGVLCVSLFVDKHFSSIVSALVFGAVRGLVVDRLDIFRSGAAPEGKLELVMVLRKEPYDS